VKARWKAQAAATMVGSMPHKDRRQVIDLILDQVPEIPVWPQLSVFPPEQMMVQYLEGLPGLKFQDGKHFIEWNSPRFDQELYAFYEEYLALESETMDIRASRFALGHETGLTFHAFLEALRRRQATPKALKGQVVGPFTLLAGLKDQDDRSALYDERLCDVVVKHLAMKACWQVELLKEFQRPVIIFLDEPALAGFGSSAFISVSREQVDRLLREIVETIQNKGAMAGIHVCANTDWLLAFQSPVDIINFDAYNYFDKFALYHQAFQKFISEGRTVAWGMVPTSDAQIIEKETPGSLAELWLSRVESLLSETITVEKILEQSIFTPSCGCASLPVAAAEKVLKHTGSLSEILKGRTGKPNP